MVLQIANITKDTPHLFPLLEEAYHKIYVPAFPDEDERESLDKFLRAVNGEIPKVGIAVNILGENLADPENHVIKGISVAYYYEPQNTGLLAYNAIAPEHREKGLGKLMVQSRIDSLKALARRQGKELGGVFIECNDPLKVSPDMDSMDPSKRIALFTDWGARQVPIDYVQPPLTAEGCYAENMVLMNYPVDGRYAGKKEIESFLRGIYREFRSDKPPEEDYFFMRIKKQLQESELDKPEFPALPGYMTGTPKFKYLR